MFSSNTLITGGTITQHNNEDRLIYTGKGSFDRLLEAASSAAFHNSGDRRDPPKCHPNTRVAVQQKIKDWILSLDPETRNSLIMWLLGPAGSGKSAIAQTIAEWAFEEGILLASYFFSRFDSTRNHPRSLVATIAYQAASYFPQVREHISTAIDGDPLIFTRSLITQICTIIIEPLEPLISSGYFNNPKSKRLIIIDGLDECEDRDGQMDILRTISKALQDYHLPLIFLIISRPEHDITYTFGSGYLRDNTSRLPLDDGYQSSSDIKLFLQDKFNEIKANHPFKTQIPPEWPADETLERLAVKSSGQFIYAATVTNFVRSTRHRPVHRLEMVLGLRPIASGRDMPFSELDALYHHVFSCVQEVEPVLQVLAFEVLTRPSLARYTVDEMERVLSLNPGDIPVLFCDLHSVIDFGTYPWQSSDSLIFLHASLDEFLLDESRSKRFYIDPLIRHVEFAQALFPCRPYSKHHEDLISCPYHLVRAQPTDTLRQKILDLNIKELLHELASQDENRSYFTEFSFLLESIHESKFDDAKELYFNHVQSFATFAAEQLVKYHSAKKLMALVAVTSIISPMVFNIHTNIYDLFQLDEQSRLMDRFGLGLAGVLINPPAHKVYLAFLKEMFADKTRLGICAPDATTYANGAIYFIRYLCCHLVLEFPCKAIRKNNPWKWRQRMAWKKPAYMKMLLKSPQQGQLVNILVKKKNGCYKSLGYLAQFLRRAGRSTELINLARGCKFGILSYVHPDKVRVAKYEVAQYLERMDTDDE